VGIAGRFVFCTVKVITRPYYALPQHLCLSFDCFTETVTKKSSEGSSFTTIGPPIDDVASEFVTFLSLFTREPLIPIGARRIGDRPVANRPYYSPPTSAQEPVRTMVQLALLTGLRMGEILALDWASVDLTTGTIRITRAYYRGAMGTPKTKCSRRSVPLPEDLRQIRSRLLQESSQSGRTGLSHLQRHALQRLQLASPGPEAGRSQVGDGLNWHMLKTDACDFVPTRGRFSAGCASAATHSSGATHGGRKTRGFDGKNGQNPEGLPLALQQIQ
jgi:hypothetical protein